MITVNPIRGILNIRILDDAAVVIAGIVELNAPPGSFGRITLVLSERNRMVFRSLGYQSAIDVKRSIV
jgi:hypothetical protein